MTQVNLSSDAMTLEQDEATEAIGAARRVIRRDWNRFIRWGHPAHFRRVDGQYKAVAPRHPTVFNGSNRQEATSSIEPRKPL
jgi:hypothetical protein